MSALVGMAGPQFTAKQVRDISGQLKGYESPPELLPILPTNDTALWVSDKTAAVSVSVDHNVTFGGSPSIRVDIPANTSGTVKVGTSTASCYVPDGWDTSQFAIAFKASQAGAIQSNAVAAYIGDSSYANFWTCSATHGNEPQRYPLATEWFVCTPEAVGSPVSVSKWVVGSGAPAIASTMRAKIQWAHLSVPNPTSVWFGCFGVLPAHKPTVILSFDDGFKSWYDFVVPLALHYQLPCSFATSLELVGGANYMTSGQVTELHRHRSGLFDICNHARNNNPYGSIGATAAFQQYVDNRDYLRSIGVDHDGPNHCPWVQSQTGSDLIDLMEGGGFLSARAGALTVNPYNWRPHLFGAGDKLRWAMGCISVPQTGVTLSNVQSQVNALVSSGGVGFINLHDFAATDASFVWSKDKLIALFKWLKAQQDAGAIRVMSWSQWWSESQGETRWSYK